MYNKINSMEMQIMKLIWDNGDMRATDIDVILQEQGWSHSTVYTTIRRCVDKGFLKKRPGYWCHALLTQEIEEK